MSANSLRRFSAPIGWLSLFVVLSLAASPAQAQLMVSDSSVGYIDTAVPTTMLRLRFDAAYGNEFPDRAEFFYAQCGCNPGTPPGPPLPETGVDYQELRPYFEYQVRDNLSAFVEIPIRFINPDVNNNTSGLGDIEAGFKYLFYQDQCNAVTFQLKAYAPSGDADRGLGTNHASLEPGILFFRRMSDRVTLEAEIRDWIPLGGSTFMGENFHGNVLRYGVGLSYLAHECCHYSARPVVEVVGWSVLDGLKTDGRTMDVTSAGGDTIVNAKLGVRFGVGPYDQHRGHRDSIYVGYGQALTGDVWYDNVARIEYRRGF